MKIFYKVNIVFIFLLFLWLIVIIFFGLDEKDGKKIKLVMVFKMLGNFG